MASMILLNLFKCGDFGVIVIFKTLKKLVDIRHLFWFGFVMKQQLRSIYYRISQHFAQRAQQNRIRIVYRIFNVNFTRVKQIMAFFEPPQRMTYFLENISA